MGAAARPGISVGRISARERLGRGSPVRACPPETTRNYAGRHEKTRSHSAGPAAEKDFPQSQATNQKGRSTIRSPTFLGSTRSKPARAGSRLRNDAGNFASPASNNRPLGRVDNDPPDLREFPNANRRQAFLLRWRRKCCVMSVRFDSRCGWGAASSRFRRMDNDAFGS